MKRFWQLCPALLCMAAFALSATLWAAVGLGTKDAMSQWASLPAVHCLSVYPRHEAGMPSLDNAFVKRQEALTEVRCVLPVAEVPATISGAGYSVDVVIRAVPESKLAEAHPVLSLGKYPNSTWHLEALLGSGAASQLAAAAKKVGQALPSRAKLYIGSIAACSAGNIPPEEITFAGTATSTSSDAGNILWMDAKKLQTLMNKSMDLSSEPGITLAPVRADIYMNDVLQMDALARQLNSQGYLAVNPLQEQAMVLQDGEAMTRQWSILTILSGLAATLAAWRCFRSFGLKSALAGVAACAIGMAAAVALMQPAMLLGWHFIISGNARYLLDLPRVIAIFAVSITISLFGVQVNSWTHQPACALAKSFK